jgi:hypothetical protein
VDRPWLPRGSDGRGRCRGEPCGKIHQACCEDGPYKLDCQLALALHTTSSFRLVLTPKNDPISHNDHFHIEANPRYAAPRS